MAEFQLKKKVYVNNYVNKNIKTQRRDGKGKRNDIDQSKSTYSNKPLRNYSTNDNALYYPKRLKLSTKK